MEPRWEFLTKTIYDPAIFWAMVTATATVLLVFATIALVWVGVIPLVRERKAEFAERFRLELFTPGAQKIFFLAAHGFLRFEVDASSGVGFFMIIQAQENIIEQRLRQIFGEQRSVLTFEMDDQFLAPLEEVAHYESIGVIDFEDVYRSFADFVDVAVTNRAIQEYVQWLRKRAGWKVYAQLETLHAKLKAAEKKRKKIIR
jgi:hypothetical protein